MFQSYTKLIPKRVLITGGSGLIGSRLTGLLLSKGIEVVHLGRRERKGQIPVFTWDIEKGLFDLRALAGVDAIVHLAGAGIADKPWTARRKQEILESRTQSTALLHKTLRDNPHQVTTVVCASAIGYYGFGGSEETFEESSRPGKDFLAEVVKAWEAEAEKISELGIRLVKIRIGIVLSAEGGALKEMAKPVKWNVGAPLGKGTQMMSWIHIDDLCRMFLFALENQAIDGVYNGVSPEPVSNRELTYAVAAALGKKIWLPPVPGFALKLLLGEMADLVLKGSRVSAKKIISAGFDFRFKDIEAAVKDLLRS